MKKSIKILGIESSCDDTGVALILDKEIISNIIISQNNEHQLYQGVVPEIAARSHLQNLQKALRYVLAESRIALSEIDAVAATSGPGLIGGVIVGSMFGRTIASVVNKPFIAVNHLEAHALTARLTNELPYPYLLLLISGGHCQFIAVQAVGKYKIIGRTIDDSVGETFDKIAKMLGLAFPGGAEIERRAVFGDPNKYILPKPIIGQVNCDMSFSGLKTAMRTLINKLAIIGDQEINDLAASFQYTIGEILSAKMRNSIKYYEAYLEKSSQLINKTLVIAGGVAANQYLRSLLAKEAVQHGYVFLAPPAKLCTDNAAMIAYTGLERLQNNLTDSLNFCPRARWSLEELSTHSLSIRRSDKY